MKAILYKKDTSVNWYVQLSYYDENNKRKLKSIKTDIPVKGNNKRKAEEKRKQILKEYEEKFEKQNINSIQDTLFSDYIEKWLCRQKNYVELTTWEGYCNVIKKHIQPYFKSLNIKLQDLKPEHIQKYYDIKLEEGLSSTTVKRHHANIHKSLKDALYQNIISYNPADRVKLPKAVKYKPNFFTQDQIQQLLECIKGEVVEPAIILGCYFGLRRGECCGLRWSSINFKEKTIEINHTITGISTVQAKDKTKNESSHRFLPLFPEVEKYLLALKEQQEIDRKLLGNEYEINDYVCKWNTGKPLSPFYITHKFGELLEKNNLPHIRFHDLRHSNISLLLKSGMSLKHCSLWAGHSTISITADTYAHLDMSSKIEMGNVLNELFKSE